MPPPIGGVANHILRYSKKNKIKVYTEQDILNLKSKKIIKLFLEKEVEIHVHTTRWRVLLILCIKMKIINRKCKYVFVNHNFSIVTQRSRMYKTHIIQLLIRYYILSCEKVYVVNNELIPKMKKMYGKLVCQLYEPFVPPDIRHENDILLTYSKELIEFIRIHSPIICSGAWKLSMNNGKDLYGFDLLIELISIIVSRYPKIGLVFFIGDMSYNNEYFRFCINKITESNIRDSIFIVTGQKEMWPIIRRSDLFIRATDTDGDPLSVKEALYLNTGVLASNCIDRPPNVETFKNRDLSSLICKTLFMLNGTGYQDDM